MAYLADLFQQLIELMVKIFFLMSRLNLSSSTFHPLFLSSHNAPSRRAWLFMLCDRITGKAGCEEVSLSLPWPLGHLASAHRPPNVGAIH